jgi:hypothetical protein
MKAIESEAFEVLFALIGGVPHPLFSSSSNEVV